MTELQKSREQAGCEEKHFLLVISEQSSRVSFRQKYCVRSVVGPTIYNRIFQKSVIC